MPHNICRSAFTCKTVLLVGVSKKIHLYIVGWTCSQPDSRGFGKKTARKLLLRSLVISFDSLLPLGTYIYIYIFLAKFTSFKVTKEAESSAESRTSDLQRLQPFCGYYLKKTTTKKKSESLEKWWRHRLSLRPEPTRRCWHGVSPPACGFSVLV